MSKRFIINLQENIFKKMLKKICLIKIYKWKMEENERRLKTIKNEIIKLIQKNGLTTSGIKNDCEGYLYCISNSIHCVYSTDIYKLGITIIVIPF